MAGCVRGRTAFLRLLLGQAQPGAQVVEGAVHLACFIVDLGKQVVGLVEVRAEQTTYPLEVK